MVTQSLAEAIEQDRPRQAWIVTVALFFAPPPLHPKPHEFHLDRE